MQVCRSSNLEFSNQTLSLTNLYMGYKHEISLGIFELKKNLDTNYFTFQMESVLCLYG